MAPALRPGGPKALAMSTGRRFTALILMGSDYQLS